MVKNDILQTIIAETNEKVWYKKWWGILLAIIFWPFFVIWYAWARSKWSKTIKIVVTVLAVGALGTAVAASDPQQNPSTDKRGATTQQNNAAQKQSASKKAAEKPKYQASVLNKRVVDPATVLVAVSVKNVGTVEGKPSCTVTAQNSSGTYKGFDIFDAGKSLKPGETYSFNAQLVITKEGAAYVTEGNADCS